MIIHNPLHSLLRLATRLAPALLLFFQFGCEVPEIKIGDTDSTPVAEQTAEDVNNQDAAQEPREFTANDPKRGKKSRAVGGYAGAVFGARFWAEHQMIINQIKHALDLYNAEHGFYPKTEKEFEEKIIQFNQIQLPELDEVQEYIYDPADHTLKVQRKGEEGETAESEE